MRLVMDYVIALTHLYGLVHKDKVVEIYNLQNDEQIGVEDLDDVAQDNVDAFDNHFVTIYKDYFVHKTIMEFKEFEQELLKREGKPFYIPTQSELLKYKDDFYVEASLAYKALKKYVQRNFFNGDAYKAEIVCEDVQGVCQYSFSLNNAFEPFDRSEIVFDSEGQVQEVMELIMELANNTRLWENNGFTPEELGNRTDRNARNVMRNPGTGQEAHARTGNSGGTVVHEKIGRNDPCPCRSGRKYKKCCLGT